MKFKVWTVGGKETIINWDKVVRVVKEDDGVLILFGPPSVTGTVDGVWLNKEHGDNLWNHLSARDGCEDVT